MTQPEPPVISERFARTITDVYGREGHEWLRALPRLLDALARDWGLSIGPPFVLTYNYVAPAVLRDGSQAVLKVGVPSREFASEARALEVFGGEGAVLLLASDVARGAMLIERLDPGMPLTESDDAREAARVAARVMRRLWKPAPATAAFRTVDDWCRGFQRLRDEFNGDTGPFDDGLVAAAESALARARATPEAPVLLHGDLHHDNILSAGGEWRAIDPKGVIGDAAFEVYAFLKNPATIHDLPDAAMQRLLETRLDVFAEELGLERERLRAWGLVGAMLSAWWSYEENGRGWDGAMRVARLLA